MMLKLYAGSLAVDRPFPHQEVPDLVKAEEIFSWMMCSAEEMNTLSGNVNTEGGAYITVATVKMPVSFVQVLSFLL